VIHRDPRANSKTSPTIADMKRLALIAALALLSLSARADLPFIENDYAKALAQASAKNVPLFVEAWAPW
jgi:hypothetical protein